jgi:rhodanese-related sulfurtransferase
MKKFLKYFMLTLLVSSFVLAGCKKDDDDDPTPATPTAFETLTSYMISNNMDVDVVISDWITDAAAVNAKGSDAYYIIDIRSEADFNLGHIEGAVNSTLGGILDKAAMATKPILVVCYTGQTAGHGVMALRLSGYTDAKVLKWGMAGWTADLSSPWENNIGDEADNYPASWAAAPGNITTPLVFSSVPNIQSTSTDGATILAERVSALLSNGFNKIANTDVLTSPSSYFINNYWAMTDVEHYGNIQPAYRLLPFTLADGTYMNLDPSKEIVNYCWTGQTSSMLTAYMYILGYNAKSLLFGTNGMIYGTMESHKYTVPTMNYPVVPTK